MEQNIYRLTGLDYTQSKGVQLPIKGQLVEKIVEENNRKISKGRKRIVYIEGSSSIFEEDQVGDLQPKPVWFKFGDLKVAKDDIALNKIIKSHKWFKSGKVVLWSQESEDKQNLADLRFKGDARALIEDSSEEKIKAIALAVFGQKAILWSVEKSELELRKYADEKPKKLKEVMGHGDYQAKLLAGQAFVYDIAKENDTKTAVIWTDSDGIIIKLAKGENGISELGRFLSKRTDESADVLQSIGDRVNEKLTDTEPDTDSVKDLEIAELKAKLAALEPKGEDNTELVEAQKAYEAKFDKKLPPSMKNNLIWINKKLAE